MAGHVYLIGSRKYNWYKIGKSSNAAIRIADLGILLPFRIEVIAVWKASNHHELERLLHQKYESNRINGEWFTFGQPQIEKIVSEMTAVQVEVAVGFSNIPKQYQEITVPRKPGGGFQKKLDRMTKEIYSLQQQLKDAGINPVIQ